MTADEMFEKFEYDNSIVFDKRLTEIYFFKAEKTFCGVEAFQSKNFTMEELKAINKKCEELGWNE